MFTEACGEVAIVETRPCKRCAAARVRPTSVKLATIMFV